MTLLERGHGGWGGGGRGAALETLKGEPLAVRPLPPERQTAGGQSAHPAYPARAVQRSCPALPGLQNCAQTHTGGCLLLSEGCLLHFQS